MARSAEAGRLAGHDPRMSPAMPEFSWSEDPFRFAVQGAVEVHSSNPSMKIAHFPERTGGL